MVRVFDLTVVADICPDGVLAHGQLQLDNGLVVETTNNHEDEGTCFCARVSEAFSCDGSDDGIAR